MSMNDLKISIITPSFNSGKYIERAIESVLIQDYKNYEHIIVDGGSTDNTINILEKYKTIRYISENDNGQADAMNKGFRISTGDIIVFLNADDYFFPGAFSSVISEFKKGAKFVVGNILIKSKRLKSEFVNIPRVKLEEMLRHWEPNAFPHNPLGYFYLREIQEKCPFNINNYATMDLEFLLDAASKYKFTKIDFTLGCFEDGLKTKTGQTQSRFDYWKPSNFPYLEKYIKNWPLKEAVSYKKDRREGYIIMQSHLNRINKNRIDENINKYWVKKEMPLVSIIIPTYNCRNYIEKAISSVLNNNYENIELIIIDDASTDSTFEMLQKKYNNNNKVVIIKNEKNIKLGASRNKGMEIANGKYIFFLDADDWINKNAFKKLVFIAEEYNAEIVACGVDKVLSDGKKEEYNSFSLSSDNWKETLHYFINYRIGSIVWNKLYLKEFLDTNNLKFIFPYWHEDIIFTTKAMYHCRNFISISDKYYNYYQRKTSIVNGQKDILHLESYFIIYKESIKFFREMKILKEKEGFDIYKNFLENHCFITAYNGVVDYAKTNMSTWKDDLKLAYENVFKFENVEILDLIIKAVNNELILFSPTKQLDQGQEELNRIYNSYEWKLIRKLENYFRVLFPNSSLRKKFIIKLIKLLMRLKKSLLSMNKN